MICVPWKKPAGIKLLFILFFYQIIETLFLSTFNGYVSDEIQKRGPDIVGIEQGEPISNLSRSLRTNPKVALFFTRRTVLTVFKKGIFNYLLK